MKKNPNPLDLEELNCLTKALAKMAKATEALMDHVARHPSEDGIAEMAVLSLRARLAEWRDITKEFL